MLRRRDGASVYTVAGADLFTSTTVLSAERRLVATAGRIDGRVAAPAAVDLALLETAANGVELNTGQAALVRDMATSGRRLQLAIAPAGAGKTTAMRALTAAWARIWWHRRSAWPLQRRQRPRWVTRPTRQPTPWPNSPGHYNTRPAALPDWVDAIGPTTLVLIDEAGMADTLSLDTAVSFVLGRGGSVRLIGDDQQLAAIGAGGVLRDIKATHGALHLSELMRFTMPAEGLASLALREGKPEALGFYLDTGRVHVGDLATMTEDVFQSWAADRAEGRDAIMLAPTRELAAELNHLARAHRLNGETQPGPSLRLADGNEASVGDLVITRANDRTLRMSPTDWVKNGDRWTILAVPGDGTLQVQHARNERMSTLPAAYVTESTELGYATTVHTAQGVTADVMHGLATGDESRQQLYTMLTRGKHANHVYLQVVGDGDEHALVRPETVHPRTATDLLENILARDASPVSATTMLRDQDDPAHLLGQATGRYHDALVRRRARPVRRSEPAPARPRRRRPGPRPDRCPRLAHPTGTPDPARRQRRRPRRLARRGDRLPGTGHRPRRRSRPGLAVGRHRVAQRRTRPAAVDPRRPPGPRRRPDVGHLPHHPGRSGVHPGHRGRPGRDQRAHPAVGTTRRPATNR